MKSILAVLILTAVSPLCQAQVGKSVAETLKKYGYGEYTHGYYLIKKGAIEICATPEKPPEGLIKMIIYSRPNSASEDGRSHLTRSEIDEFLAHNGTDWKENGAKTVWKSKAGDTAEYSRKTLMVTLSKTR